MPKETTKYDMVTAMEVSNVPAKRRIAPKTPTWRQENFLSIGPLSKPGVKMTKLIYKTVFCFIAKTRPNQVRCRLLN